MNLKDWAVSNKLHPQTAYRWFEAGVLPVRAERVGPRMVMVFPDATETVAPVSVGGLGLYSRVSSHDQKADLNRQADRLNAWAFASGLPVVSAVSEVGSGMNGSRPKLRKLLANPEVTTIVVEHRDRLGRMNTELVEAALSASGRRLVVVDSTELDDDLVRDMTEVLTSFCARLYGRRSAANRAAAAVAAAAESADPVGDVTPPRMYSMER
ncbi:MULTISPECIES: IS607 family transposase [unclassified Cryobacterium]|uniref:IS607 family transposase n=1 Tax=unclassified Cryobacterium TaxID=2649013 RepID=UPI002AB58D41|nr:MULTISPECIES: IS607 family transposase [unclassified Cryobacterium]MDY7526511.1 IS607 family transposase [Cryobacterium sp. 10C2]MDY7557678.1 IS607 family transposase [Cryobacterium sp. 10C3]MEA9999683.1 IS607 family transposase [Cryobacterium sp. RTS3]MEB0289869.1 IS607 family transposase [Cryobacterium sp. 10C2]